MRSISLLMLGFLSTLSQASSLCIAKLEEIGTELRGEADTDHEGPTIRSAPSFTPDGKYILVGMPKIGIAKYAVADLTKPVLVLEGSLGMTTYTGGNGEYDTVTPRVLQVGNRYFANLSQKMQTALIPEWNLETGALVQTIDPSPGRKSSYYDRELATSADGKRLVLFGQYRTYRVFDLENRVWLIEDGRYALPKDDLAHSHARLYELYRGKSNECDAAYSLDSAGEKFATLCRHGMLMIVDVATGKSKTIDLRDDDTVLDFGLSRKRFFEERGRFLATWNVRFLPGDSEAMVSLSYGPGSGNSGALEQKLFVVEVASGKSRPVATTTIHKTSGGYDLKGVWSRPYVVDSSGRIFLSKDDGTIGVAALKQPEIEIAHLERPLDVGRRSNAHPRKHRITALSVINLPNATTRVAAADDHGDIWVWTTGLTATSEAAQKLIRIEQGKVQMFLDPNPLARPPARWIREGAVTRLQLSPDGASLLVGFNNEEQTTHGIFEKLYLVPLGN